MYCPGGNATDPIWRVPATSDGISSWTPLKPQHSNPNPNPLANQLWSLLLPHLSSSLTDSLPSLNLIPLKNWWSIHARWSKSRLKHSMRFCGIFLNLKRNFIAYRSSSRPDCIFEIHLLWQSGFSRVYSNYCCSCSFEPEIIRIGQSSQKMCSNNIVNYQESTTILNAYTKKATKKQKVWKLLEGTTYITKCTFCTNIISLDSFAGLLMWRVFSRNSPTDPISLQAYIWFEFGVFLLLDLLP